MADIKLKNWSGTEQTYAGVQKIVVPKQGGTEEFVLPSGSLTINSNGTYDVTQYLSAVVSTPAAPSNFLYWDFSYTTPPTSDTIIVFQNQTVKAHKNDSTARLIWMFMGSSTWQQNKCKFCYSCNTPFYWSSSTSSDYICSISFGAQGYSWEAKNSFSSGDSNLPLYVDSNGNIKFLTYSKFYIPTGSSRLIFMW